MYKEAEVVDMVVVERCTRRRKFLAYSGTEVGGIVLCDAGKIHRGREDVRSSNFLDCVLRCLHAYTLIQSL